MKGKFRYFDATGQICETNESTSIPPTATELLAFFIDAPPEPHDDATHALIEDGKAEFDRVYEMVYNQPPPKTKEGE